MNKAFAIVLCVLAVSCANNTSFKKSISYQGNNMHVAFKSVVDGQTKYDYEHTFDVTGFSQEQKDAIIKHIADSLSIR